MDEIELSGGEGESDVPIILCALAAVAAIAGAGYLLGRQSGRSIPTEDILSSAVSNRVRGLG